MIGISDRYEVVPQGGLFLKAATGFRLAQTNRQTDRQTDRQTYTQAILYLSNVMHCIEQTTSEL